MYVPCTVPQWTHRHKFIGFMLLSRVSSKDRDNRMSHLRIRVKFTQIKVHKSISGNAKVYYVLTFVPQYADYFQGCIFISSCKTMNILFNYNFKIYRCQFACRFNSSAKVFIVSVFTVLIPTWDSHEQLLPQGPLNQASYFSLIYKGFKPQCLKQSQNCYQVKVVFLLLLYQYYNNILNTTIICCFDRSVI